jgi:UDP-N-acetylglucosamine 2-epimerase (non-hydrolysing)
MQPRKILAVVGTRPEAIKLAPVILELRRQASRFLSRVCATGQHREMLDQALGLFDIKPDYDLDIMVHGQALAQITASAIQGLDRVLAEEVPDVVLVQGDTTTAFCGALAAYYRRVAVGHVEAGLRTGRKYAPFPEEINRSLIARVTDYHFSPTAQARNALLHEGIPASSIYVTGNTVIDALLWVRDRIRVSPPPLPEGLASALDGRQFVLVTGHRRESFGEGFENICRAIRDVADSQSDIMFVYPVHLNPNVREPVYRILGGHERIRLVAPLPYESFVWLMDRASVVLTDSGGVQEEAPSLGKPVLVMRDTTERPEGVAAGNARLVGTRRERIVEELSRLMNDSAQRAAIARVSNPYGDGHAAMRIANILAND